MTVLELLELCYVVSFTCILAWLYHTRVRFTEEVLTPKDVLFYIGMRVGIYPYVIIILVESAGPLCDLWEKVKVILAMEIF